MRFAPRYGAASLQPCHSYCSRHFRRCQGRRDLFFRFLAPQAMPQRKRSHRAASLRRRLCAERRTQCPSLMRRLPNRLHHLPKRRTPPRRPTIIRWTLTHWRKRESPFMPQTAHTHHCHIQNPRRRPRRNPALSLRSHNAVLPCFISLHYISACRAVLRIFRKLFFKMPKNRMSEHPNRDYLANPAPHLI